MFSLKALPSFATGVPISRAREVYTYTYKYRPVHHRYLYGTTPLSRPNFNNSSQVFTVFRHTVTLC